MNSQPLFFASFGRILFLSFAFIFSSLFNGFAQEMETDLSDQVIVKRTAFGVPHIYADNLKAAGYALGFVQMEDYGHTVSDGLIKGRGEWAKYRVIPEAKLADALDEDLVNRRKYLRAVETWALLGKETQDILEGFALGVNRYIALNPDEFKEEEQPHFTGYDVHAIEIESASTGAVNRLIKKLKEKRKTSLQDQDFYSPWVSLAKNYVEPHPDLGSNAWALAPERTTSGKPILLRNPHLNWDAGYYEAHVVVPGKLDFYGDYRVGGPLMVIGGFNRHLGWATTNNHNPLEEIYAFERDKEDPDHYILDEASVPIQKQEFVLRYKKENGTYGEKKLPFYYTSYGPVVYRERDHIYVIKSAEDGEYRNSEQYLKMMKTHTLEEWKEAMRMLGIVTSNYTYADGAGNIFYVWNGRVPILPEWKGEEPAVYAARSSQIWTDIYPWDSLPQLLNPEGGYVHNENDPFYFTNLNAVFDEADFPPYFPQPKFGLRSQKSYELLQKKEKLALEDVIELKYDEGMLLADRVKEDLVQAVKNAENPEPEIRKAIQLIEKWNNTVEIDSRGGELFRIWWDRYTKQIKQPYKQPWSAQEPTTTPYGLANEKAAREAFEWAVGETKKKYGSWDVSWGDVHRALTANGDYAVGGCSGTYGCFRVLWFYDKKINGRNRRVTSGGDGWVIAIEFDDVPKAYSVLAYGQSGKPDNPYYYNQLDMFAQKKMKKVVYQEEAVKEQVIEEYCPGK